MTDAIYPKKTLPPKEVNFHESDGFYDSKETFFNDIDGEGDGLNEVYG